MLQFNYMCVQAKLISKITLMRFLSINSWLWIYRWDLSATIRSEDISTHESCKHHHNIQPWVQLEPHIKCILGSPSTVSFGASSDPYCIRINISAHSINHLPKNLYYSEKGLCDPISSDNKLKKRKSELVHKGSL